MFPGFKLTLHFKLHTRGIFPIKYICLPEGPGGFFQYIMYNIPSLGFVQESLDALVDGIYESIVLAHNSITPGNILVNQGMLIGANINRFEIEWLLVDDSFYSSDTHYK